MRDIKFKCWQRGVVYVVVCIWYRLGRVGHVVVEDPSCKDDILTLFPEYGEMTLLQFTGLHDKHGNEIYEGDIVERKYFHNNPPSKRPKVKYILAKLPVVFDDGKFYLDDSEIRSTDYGTTFNSWWGDGCEIIGNIYEHPELLTQLNKQP